jgi:hypothetical protein
MTSPHLLPLLPNLLLLAGARRKNTRSDQSSELATNFTLNQSTNLRSLKKKTTTTTSEQPVLAQRRGGNASEHEITPET